MPLTRSKMTALRDLKSTEAGTVQVTLIITTKLLLIQSDLVSLSLTIALPKALGSASARGEFSPSTRASPPLVSIANHAGVGSLQGEA